jgi:hypothetical protein
LAAPANNASSTHHIRRRRTSTPHLQGNRLSSIVGSASFRGLSGTVMSLIGSCWSRRDLPVPAFSWRGSDPNRPHRRFRS